MPATQPTGTVIIGDWEIKRIGLGTNRLADTEEDRTFLKAAVDAGLDFIDTADIYQRGASEKTIGWALAPFPDELVVATKAGYESTPPAKLRLQIEQSFERLRTDRIALHYLHRVHPEVPLEESVGVLKEFVDAGRIVHVGLSEVSVEQIAQAQDVTPIAAVQNEFNIGERKWNEVIDYCEAEEIVFVPFEPLRGDTDAVAEVAKRHSATPSQVKLAWLLARSPVVAPIPGTRSIDHLRENLEALDLKLSPEDLDALN